MVRVGRFPLQSSIAAICTFQLVCVSSPLQAQSSAHALTIADGIESSRAIAAPTQPPNSIFISPDGSRYVLMIVRGELREDRVVLEVWSGRLTSVDDAAPTRVATLFTTGLGYPHGLGMPAGSPILTSTVNVPTWIDNERIAFLWDDSAAVNQLVELNAVTGQLKYLSHESEDVISYLVGPQGTLVYDVRPSFSHQASDALLQNGFSVSNSDAASLLAGNADGRSLTDLSMCTRELLVPGATGSIPLPDPATFCQISYVNPLAWASRNSLISPSGQRMVLNRSPADIPADWQRFQDEDLQHLLKQYAADPSQLESRLLTEVGIQTLATSASFRSLHIPVHWRLSFLHAAWSANETSVLLWPTFIPPNVADTAGLRGEAIAFVDLNSGRISQLPIAPELMKHIVAARVEGRTVAIVGLDDHRDFVYGTSHGRWHKIAERRGADDRRGERLPPPPMVHVEMRETANSPPTLYAIDERTQLARAIFELNPKFGKEILLSKVEFIRWTGKDNKQRTGRLYYPMHYEVGRRYPLVIQVNGPGADDEFTLYGPSHRFGAGSGPGDSAFLGQTLAGVDIAVFETTGLDPRDSLLPELAFMQAESAGLSEAAHHMIDLGVAKPDAVGLMGFSAGGRSVEYAITYSPFNYAAAVVTDAADANYLQAALLGWPDNSSDMVGGQPFGSDLQYWLRNSPAFNVEKVRTPLQLQVTSSGDGLTNVVLSGWEMFSRLRYLHKPVELYVIPDVAHGSHVLQNPKQLFALQTRTLDWWRYWLKGEASTDPKVAAEYGRWQRSPPSAH